MQFNATYMIFLYNIFVDISYLFAWYIPYATAT